MSASHCGSVCAASLGLPAQVTVPESKGSLPMAMFLRLPISAKLKQRLRTQIESATMLAVMRPEALGVDAGDGRMPELLVIGLRLADGVEDVPVEVVELVASVRARSGIVFACVRDVPREGGTREECALAVRRAVPVKPGRPASAKVYAGDWRPSGETRLSVPDADGTTMAGIWDSLCAQTILGTTDGMGLDAALARRDELARLRADEAKLSRDHQRAKNPAQRNEIYAKLHKVRAQIDRMEV